MAVEQKTGVMAGLSILLAIGSFIITCTGHPGWGLLAAILAIPLGVIGLVISASPRVGGGLLSIVAIAIAVIGLIFAIVGLAGAVVF